MVHTLLRRKRNPRSISNMHNTAESKSLAATEARESIAQNQPWQKYMKMPEIKAFEESDTKVLLP